MNDQPTTTADGDLDLADDARDLGMVRTDAMRQIAKAARDLPTPDGYTILTTEADLNSRRQPHQLHPPITLTLRLQQTDTPNHQVDVHIQLHLDQGRHGATFGAHFDRPEITATDGSFLLDDHKQALLDWRDHIADHPDMDALTEQPQVALWWACELRTNATAKLDQALHQLDNTWPDTTPTVADITAATAAVVAARAHIERADRLCDTTHNLDITHRDDQEDHVGDADDSQTAA